MAQARKCNHCNKTKNISNFETYKRHYGVAVRKTCIECTTKLRAIPEVNCMDCKETKPRREFPNSRNAVLGIEQVCKKCKRATVIASNKHQKIARDRRGRYKSDPEFRERLKAHSKKSRDNNRERSMLSQAKIRARRNSIPFTLTLEDIVIPTYCPILGIKISTTNHKRLGDSASLDKVDNTKGYIKGNVRVISYMANHIKGKASRKELEMFAKNIILYLDNKI